MRGVVDDSLKIACPFREMLSSRFHAGEVFHIFKFAAVHANAGCSDLTAVTSDCLLRKKMLLPAHILLFGSPLSPDPEKTFSENIVWIFEVTFEMQRPAHVGEFVGAAPGEKNVL